ncbi:hypothetical protein ACLOJK_027862 [Asimina triloba]
MELKSLRDSASPLWIGEECPTYSLPSFPLFPVGFVFEIRVWSKSALIGVPHNGTSLLPIKQVCLLRVLSNRTSLEGDLAWLGRKGWKKATESVHIERRPIALRGVDLALMLGWTDQTLPPEGSCGLLA